MSTFRKTLTEISHRFQNGMSTATDKSAPQIGRGVFSKRPLRMNVSSAYLLLLLPVVAVVVVLACSPNYRPQHGTRAAPLGGDFVQDYAGGSIVLSADRAELYDLDHFRRVQHDGHLVGFEWSSSSYYPPVYPPFYYLAVSPLSRVGNRLSQVFDEHYFETTTATNFQLNEPAEYQPTGSDQYVEAAQRIIDNHRISENYPITVRTPGQRFTSRDS